MKTKNQPAAPSHNSPLKSVLALASRWSAAERLELLRSGVVIPHAADDEDPLEHVFGYRCRHCGDLSLRFLGSRFIDGSGNEIEQPPEDVPIAMIPWTQDCDITQLNRHSPLCQNQNCRQLVSLHDGKFLYRNMVVTIAQWQASRSVPRVRRTRQLAGVASPEPLDDGWVKTPPIGSLVSQEVRSKAEDIAQQHGLDSLKVS